MAGNKGVNKSQAIRDFLTANPNMKVKEVVDALGKTGLKVSDNLVYNIKGRLKEKRRRKAHVVKAAKAAATTAFSNSTSIKTDAITMIREVKALAKKAGGYAKLKDLVDALAE
jgi:hypothetical protein